MKDPRIAVAKLNFYTFVFLNTSEMGWFLYGNIVVFYGDRKALDNKDYLLYKLMIGMVIYGYISTVVYCLSCCGMCFMVCTLGAMGGFSGDRIG